MLCEGNAPASVLPSSSDHKSEDVKTRGMVSRASDTYRIAPDLPLIGSASAPCNRSCTVATCLAKVARQRETVNVVD